MFVYLEFRFIFATNKVKSYPTVIFFDKDEQKSTDFPNRTKYTMRNKILETDYDNNGKPF